MMMCLYGLLERAGPLLKGHRKCTIGGESAASDC
jgi:hypothetical protein